MKPLEEELYDFQAEGVEKFAAWFQDTGADAPTEALISLAVGMGKTRTAASCIRRLLTAIKPSARILWLTHREELIAQSKRELELYTGEYCEIEQAHHRSTGLANIIVGSVATLHGKRLQNLAADFQPDLIVCDEAHHALALSWMQVKQTFPRARILNLTATPYRSDIGNRLDLGLVLVERNTTDGIGLGILVPPKPVGKLELNLGDVKKRLGDYDADSLSTLLCHPDILRACVKLLQEHAPGRKTILFAATVEHGKRISSQLREAGFRVAEVYGDTPTPERVDYYRGIREGKWDVLANNLCLDAQTEILTLDGWKNHQTLTRKDLVANWEGGRIWFSPPKDIIVRPRKPGERMVVLPGTQSLRVTEGHRMLVLKNQDYVHVPSQELIGAAWKYPVCGQQDLGQTASQIPLPPDEPQSANPYKQAKSLNRHQCAFIGLWLGKGAKDQLASGHRCLAPYLQTGKNLLWWDLSADQLKALFRGFMLAEGSGPEQMPGGERAESFKLTSADMETLGQLQAVAVCRGYQAELTRVGARFTLALSRQLHVSVGAAEQGLQWDTQSPAEEIVWCASTESTNLIIRRNGCVSVIGNCLTEGFNLPALDLVAMFRPTRNAGLYLQCIGRGLRRDPENLKKDHCLIIDVVDTAKRKGGKEFPLPTDDDSRIYSALHNRQASLPEVFLSWFYSLNDLERLVQKQITVTQCDRLDTPQKLHRLLSPPWMQSLPGQAVDGRLPRVWTVSGQYPDLLQPFRLNDPDAFRLLASHKGWVYLPHNRLPKHEEALVELAAQVTCRDSANRNYTIETLISRDAQLRNFILNLFDPNQSLKEQAAKCYDLLPLCDGGPKIAWFKVIGSEADFNFIQWKDAAHPGLNRFLVRTKAGLVYSFRQEGTGPVTPEPGYGYTYDDLPDFVKGTRWANQRMSGKQAEHVCRILSISAAEAERLRISKLSASALMSNHWHKARLKRIAEALGNPQALTPAAYHESIPMPFPGEVGETLRETENNGIENGEMFPEPVAAEEAF
ncbi:MAG TPA: DEAD/DEAH box helicase family protein [Terriglobia bacterium]|nr:DEAD/DEAH box helicase family protein [Terriglobia bacterium]